jgi:hypothetical protein
MKALRYVLLFGLLGVPFGILGRMIYLDSYYYASAPRAPDLARGAVVPAKVHHGATVFLTSEEWCRFRSPTAEAVQCTAFLFSAVAAFMLNRRWKLLRNSRDLA